MLEKYRQQIDQIDDKIAQLYNERMQIVSEIGKIKAQNGIHTLDKSREKDIINRVTKNVSNEIKIYLMQVFNAMFETAKAQQGKYLQAVSQLAKSIENLSNKVFPTQATVACQGAIGSYSGQATERLFQLSEITYFKNFDSVFNAVEKGLCRYGILPIENSSIGSVNEVYDLMKAHNFYICRSVKQKISHNILAKKGVKLTDIKEIVSKEEALMQCQKLLKSLKDVKITIFENTATAARYVAENSRNDIAAISSRNCAELYGLSIVKDNIQDNNNNYTRFICISKELEIYENSNRISLMVNLPHRAGSLNEMLNKFSILGLNLTKIESRPIPESAFEFMFYFDFEASVTSPNVKSLINDLDNSGMPFTFLGGYLEVI